jgi:prepilin-type N-terminal cleavage/methylation domain-containing protein
MRPTRDAGFTLVELLVAITVGTIVIAVLGQAVAIGLKTTTSTATTLVDAVHSRALTSGLLTDVGSAQQVRTTAAPPCGANPPPVGTVLWTQDPDGDVAVYTVTDIPADPVAHTVAFSQLRRQTCTDDPVQLASWAQPDAPAMPRVVKVLCDGRPDCGGIKHLAAPDDLSASATQVKLDDVAGFPDPDNGTDPVAPYTITVGTEAMTVVDADLATHTLKVSRPSGETHAVGDAVTYTPANVAITVPRADSAACDAPTACGPDDDPYTLTVSPSSS